MSRWHPVIGLEIHIQLNTKSKLFSPSPAHFTTTPNIHVSLIDLAMPGALPVLNGGAVDKAIMFGLAAASKVNQYITFDRKNYFYPDLPKGYQITQHYHPILSGGHVHIEVDGSVKLIRLHHTHMEEDAGKSIHGILPDQTGVDLNRAGTPLLEVVSEPDMRSAKEAVAFMKKLHTLVTALDICDGNMQEGSFRVDANVSIRPSANAPFGTRAEIKNINSFRFVEKAIDYEIQRQIKICESGGTVKQQTRLFNEKSQTTVLMREKEQAHDYRYHPDPDIPAVLIAQERIDKIAQSMPELPDQKFQRFVEKDALSVNDARILADDKILSHYYDLMKQKSLELDFDDAKACATWLLGPLAALANRDGAGIFTALHPADQVQLLLHIHEGDVSFSMAKQVLDLMVETGAKPTKIIDEHGMRQISSESELTPIIAEIITISDKQVEQYLSGNEKLFGYFIGQVMKKTSGRASPELTNKIVRKLLNDKK